jgi:hypothetical protein
VARCPADARASTPERARPHRPDARQPRSWALTEHSTPANLLPRANLDAQGGLDFLSVSISPAMVINMVGKGSKYPFAYRDADGDYLSGGRTYKLNIPGPVPAANFW